MSGGLDRLIAGDHVVHFYDDSKAHIRTVSDHLAAALTAGDVVVIVARAARCDELESGVAEQCLNVDALRRDLRLVALDANRMLARFMVGSSPDPDRFESVIGGLLRSVARRRKLHVYGEMVSVLWEAGNVSGAIELEDLWVRLSSEMAFSLICGYAAHAVTRFGRCRCVRRGVRSPLGGDRWSPRSCRCRPRASLRSFHPGASRSSAFRRADIARMGF